jgi:putative FmdB family regulatory protein
MYFDVNNGVYPMPSYVYHCENCQKRFEIFLTYAQFDTTTVHCPKCGSDQVRRRIPRVRIAKSEESRLDNLMDPTQLDGIEDDPKAMGRLMRQMGNEMGDDLGPEFNEVVSRLEKGQDPEQIEKDMPDLADSFSDSENY